MFLIDCIQAFGLSGIIVYSKLKFHWTKTIRIQQGKKVFLRPNTADEYTFREIFIRKEYEIGNYINFEPKLIIDAGANVGFTSVYFALQYPEATILSLEPDIDNFEQLKTNSKLFPKINPIHAALWNKEQGIKVTDKGYGIRGFSIESGDDGNALKALTIQNLMRQYSINEIDILKIDIEGSEKEVFSSNYEKWLPITKLLIIELHDRMKPGCSKSVLSAISKFEFEMEIKGENLIFMNSKFIKH